MTITHVNVSPEQYISTLEWLARIWDHEDQYQLTHNGPGAWEGYYNHIIPRCKYSHNIYLFLATIGGLGHDE